MKEDILFLGIEEDDDLYQQLAEVNKKLAENLKEAGANV